MDFWVTIATVLPVLGLALALETRVAIVRGATNRKLNRVLALSNVVILCTVLLAEHQALSNLLDNTAGSPKERDLARATTTTAMSLLVLNPAVPLVAVAFAGIWTRVRFFPHTFPIIWGNRMQHVRCIRLQLRARRAQRRAIRYILARQALVEEVQDLLDANLAIENEMSADSFEAHERARSWVGTSRAELLAEYREFELALDANLTDITSMRAQLTSDSREIKKALRSTSARSYDIIIGMLRDQVTQADISQDSTAIEEALHHRSPRHQVAQLGSVRIT